MLLGLPLQTGGGARSYTPPGAPRYVCTVVQHAPVAPTTVSVQWGRWRQTSRITPAAPGVEGPVQGEPPAQWSDPTYRKVVW